jgi:simple sugar transport system ATP-binding protein
VGVAGVAGNGQRELAEVICGLRSLIGGTVSIGGKPVRADAPLAMIRAGVAYVPEDRSTTGSAPNMSVAENLALKAYREPALGESFFLRRKAMDERARALVERFNISTPSVATPTRKLSGGNLQKVILAREIAAQPQVLVAAYPTRGLDIGATENVRRILLNERNAGAAILLISEDLDEIFALSDRIVVMCEGRIAGEMPCVEADRQGIGLLMAGHTTAL